MRKAVIAMALLSGLMLAAWKTMQPDNIRLVVMIVLGGLMLRILLGVVRAPGGSR